MAYNVKWGRGPLVVCPANTGEPLFLVNRDGSPFSSKGGAIHLRDQCDEQPQAESAARRLVSLELPPRMRYLFGYETRNTC